PDAKQWLVQAGVSKNYFGLGNTMLYGEYGVQSDWGALNAGRDFKASAGAPPGVTDVLGVTSTDIKVWGLGIAQNLDAAASTLYLSYRHFEADITCSSTGANCTADPETQVKTTKKLQTEDMQVIYAGAIVRF